MKIAFILGFLTLALAGTSMKGGNYKGPPKPQCGTLDDYLSAMEYLQSAPFQEVHEYSRQNELDRIKAYVHRLRGENGLADSICSRF